MTSPRPGVPLPAPRPGVPLPAGRWNAAVHDALCRMLDQVVPEAGAPAPLAALDFDETCVRGDISHAVLDDLERETPGLWATYLAECAEDLRHGYVRLVGTLCGGRTEAQIAAMTRSALERGLEDGRLALVDEMGDLIRALLDRGWDVRVVTASAAPIVRSVVHHYGLEPDHVFGMRPEVLPDGRFGTRVLDPVTYREGKVAALRAFAGRDPVFAAGDSNGDRPMLSTARYALLVDRGDEGLRAVARESRWLVQEAW